MAFGTLPPIAPDLIRRILASRAAIEGERKRVTILFADIKGSTALIEKLDPEAAEQLLRPPLHRMVAAVRRYEGTVNRVQGDGIMALFGAPIAHEDNAVRAAYAALDMQKAVRERDDRAIAIRVGLHTGEVLVRAINNDLSLDYDAVGASVHLAARMEQLAEPGTILCTTETMQEIEGFVRAASLGRRPVKGIDEPLEIFQLLERTPIRTRWERSAARGLSPFVNRISELSQLHEVLQRVKHGQPQAISIVGEPGTGKSRLLHQFLTSDDCAGWTAIKTFSLAHTKNATYHAVSTLLRSLFAISDFDSMETALARVRSGLSDLELELPAYLPPICALLNLPFDDEIWKTLDPPERRARIMAALKALVLRYAASNPLLLCFEDMQWADSATKSFLRELVESTRDDRLLLLMTHRKGHEHFLDSDHLHAVVQTPPLDSSTAEEFVRTLIGSDPDHQSLRALVVERTEGTPLFIEETVRSIADSGALNPSDPASSAKPALVEIPPTVQGVIAARIDRLAPEPKALLQTASVLGNEVSIPLLRAISELPTENFQKLLGELEDGDFLYKVPIETAERSVFRHVLTQEIAYGGLSSNTRQSLHSRSVKAIEEVYGGRLDEHVETLAYHAVNGRDWPTAVKYLLQAGVKALERSAYAEALPIFEQALDLIDKQAPDIERTRLGIDIRLHMRTIFGAIGDYPRLAKVLADAENLAIAINDPLRLAQINVSKAMALNLRGDLDGSVRCGMRALEIATSLANPGVLVAARFYLGQAHLWKGQFGQAIELLADHTTLVSGPMRRARIGTTGTTSVLWLGMLAACEAYLGNFERAATVCATACQIADENPRPYDVALAYWYSGFVSSHRGDLDPALVALEHGYVAATANKIRFLVPILATTLGYAYTLAGRSSEGIPLLERGVKFSNDAGFSYGEAWSSTYLGFARLFAGQADKISALAERSLELARLHRYEAVEAAALRLSGDYFMRSTGNALSAQHNYLQAAEIAARLGLRPELAHCQVGLAQAYQELGERGEAQRAMTWARELYQNMAMEFWMPKARSVS